MRAAILLAALLSAFPLTAAPILDAHVDAGGTKPPSIPPPTWGAADIPRTPFTAINSGPLDRIELPSLRVSYAPPYVGLVGSIRLFDGSGNLLATSADTPLSNPTQDLPEWTAFVFDGANVAAGGEYEFQLSIPDGSTWWPVVNWDVFLSEGWKKSAAYTAWVEPNPPVDLNPGDVNGDGRIDLTDFGILKANFGLPGDWAHGDLDSDGRVDINDFGVLKHNFGKSSAVPEPAAITLVALAIAVLAMPCLRFRRQSFACGSRSRGPRGFKTSL